MSDVPRNRIALAVFAGCVAFVAIALTAYLFFGHNWNVAATSIDDAAGELEGYTTILYEGTEAPSSRDPERFGQDPHPAPLEAAVRDYEEKGASVVVLDSLNPSLYGQGVVTLKGDERIGIVTLSGAADQPRVQAILDGWKESGVAYALVITSSAPDASELAGVDVLIDYQKPTEKTQEEAPSGSSRFTAEVPWVGTVGAVLISPSKVISSRVVEWL